ncbi:MAG: hypothetical protein WAM75_01295, partial [Xanthobacteraceae bacterium]
VREHFDVAYAGSPAKIVVEGALIGTMPKADTKSDPQRDLLEEIAKRGSYTDWEVIGLTEALRRTERVHSDMLEVLKREEVDDLPGEEQKPEIEPLAKSLKIALQGEENYSTSSEQTGELEMPTEPLKLASQIDKDGA